MLTKKPLSLYFHFPYCDVKCAYCDFYSLPKRIIDANFFDQYIQHLKKDFLQKKILLADDIEVSTIFFGGGTPSKLPPRYLKTMIDFIERYLPFSPNIEVTLEANPESLKKDNMQSYLEIGINRLSIGIQTRKPELLRYLGRVYNKSSYFAILNQVKEAGFDNCSIDLIYGIPFQKGAQIKEDIDWAISGGVKHISAYCLNVEKSTLLYNQIKNKIKKKPSLRRQARHYNWVNDYLPTQGFLRYEISNFAKVGYESLHNMSYWKYLPYLGLGVSSHSFIDGQRLISERNLNHYLKGKYFHNEKSQVNPDLFIGLFRILEKQNFDSLKKILNKNEFTRLYSKLLAFQSQGWVELYPKGFQITTTGARFSDTMIYEACL